MSAATAGPGQLAASTRNLWLSQIVARVFRLGTIFLAARLLGVATFGTFALLLTVVELIAVSSGAGYTDYLTREVAKLPAVSWRLALRVTQLRWTYIVLATGVALAVLKLLHFSPDVVRNTAVLATALFVRAAGDSAQGILKGLGQFKILPISELVRGVLSLLLTALLLLRGYGLTGVIAAEIAGTVGSGLFLILVTTRYVDMRNSTRFSFHQVARATFAFNVYPFIINIYDRIDVVLLARLAGSVATGIYSLPYRLFSSLQIVPYGVMGALLPGFSVSRTDSEAQRRCSRAMTYLFLTASMAVLLTVSFATPVVLFVLGRDYAGSAIALKLLVWATIPAFMSHALNTLLLAAHKEKVFLWTATICTAFNITANLIFIPRYSFVAAAIVTVLTEALLFLLNFYAITKYFGHPVLPEGWLTITAVLAACLAGWVGLGQIIPQVWAGALACTVFAIYGMYAAQGWQRLRAIAGQSQ